MRKILLSLAVALSSLCGYGANSQPSPREVLPLEKWMFINEDFEGAQLSGANLSRWEEVTVPHDWAIDKHFDMNIDKQIVQVKEDGDKFPKLRTGRTGSLPVFNVGWYRCEVEGNKLQGDRISIEFDGAMSGTKLYLNGEYIGEHPYGYSSFQFDITDKWNRNSTNLISARLENKEESSRWYPGAGIYRNVRLVGKANINIAHWGTYITTPKVTKRYATVNIATELENNAAAEIKNLKLINTIYNKEGEKVASKTSKFNNKYDSEISQSLRISKPNLWDTQNPYLYTVVSEIYSEDILLDSYTSTLGVRTIEYNREQGFLLNGVVTKMKGVCLHHDLGALGAAVNYRATLRQIEIMREMGCNAIRTSHNPPSQELLAICDSLGMLVQVEAFDEWKKGKNKNGYNVYFDAWHEIDITAMVKRDRNHPSVVMWSIGNEIREQWEKDGWKVAKMLADKCRELDPTRPITAGLNGHTEAIKNNLTDVLDLAGFNYKPHDYLAKHNENPGMVIYGSETASTISSRGDYKFPAVPDKNASYMDYTMSSYDMDYVPWGTTPDMEFAQQEANDFIFGEFVWTGFDYLGEPTPYYQGTPARSSYFGIVDLAGMKKDRFYLYQSHWSDTPVLHILPHWNWEEREGKNVPVFCYTNYPEVELFVNGVSQGKKRKNLESENVYERYRLMWHDVVYQPGEIEAVAYNEDGKEVERTTIRTAGEPYAIRLTPDRSEITADGKDLSYVEIEVVDKDGNLCPRSNAMFFVSVEGGAILRALCNGSPIDQTPFSSNYMNAYNGKLMAIIQSGTELSDAKVYVTCNKLKSAVVELKIK